MKTLALALCLLCATVYAQQAAKFTNPNITDASGKRQGKWTVWLTSGYEETTRKDSLTYYRVLEYKNDKPVGEVREYFKSGKLSWDGFLMSDRPYVQDGSKASHAWSESGKLTFEGGKANLPMHPNVTDSNGLRQGWWTIRIGPDLEDIARHDADVAYYRIIEFKDNKPVGVVKDYYTTGKLYEEFTLLAMRIGKTDYSDVPDYTKPFVVYWPDGSENRIASNRIQLENYVRQGKYELALPFGEAALAATIATVGKKDFRYTYFLFQLGRVHQNLGNYAKAESLYLECLQIGGNYDGAVLQSLSNLYSWTGNYKKAEELSLQSLAMREKEYGKESSHYANALNNQAIIYANFDLKKAEKAFVEAIEIEDKVFGKNSGSGRKLSGLGNVYLQHDKYAIAWKTIEGSLRSIETEKGKGSMEYGLGLTRLATIKRSQGDLSTAEKLYNEALNVLSGSAGTGNRFYTDAKIGLGETYLMGKDYARAETHFIQAKELRLERILNFFPKLSESEKEAFYRSISTDLKKFNSYCVLRSATNPSIAGELYNNQLMTKALLLNNSSKWKQRIRASGDKKLFALYTEWESNHGLLARWYKDSSNKRKIDSLAAIANEQEKELSSRSEMFASMADKKRISWQDVKARLKPNEVAIEMIRVNKFGVTKTVVDSSDARLPRFPKYGLTDTVYYAALVVTNSSVMPELVLFPNGNDLEKRYVKLYSNSVRAQTEEKELYNQFWKPIADKLSKVYKKKPAGGIHVYFSADGVFNQININTLYNPATRKYVLDEMTVNLVTNTRDLLSTQPEDTFNQLAYLFGYPNYSFGADDNTTSVAASSLLSNSRDDNSAVVLAELPATKNEVEDISGMMVAKGWQPEVLTGDEALEEKLKDCYKPRVLHIATHGFFRSDVDQNENPLLRSGLMLAGANHTLAGRTLESPEDGVLTAYEAMNLNLDNTDLVVLSACETGLGEVSNGEGVYGLQRAFKVAGARAIIMSLWNVSDEATSQLMSAFYENWLKGQTKREAFLAAQKVVRDKYKAPYYWGAFVMVGE